MNRRHELAENDAPATHDAAAFGVADPPAAPAARKPGLLRRGDRGPLDVRFIVLVSLAGWTAMAAIAGLVYLIFRLFS